METYSVSIAFNGAKRWDPPAVLTVRAVSPLGARIAALRAHYGDPSIETFIPNNPLPGQDPSGQAGYGYSRATARDGAFLVCATPLVRVTMALA
jgi:hypothetical protein